MSSQSRKTHPARLLRQLSSDKLWTRLALRIIPVNGLKRERARIADLYANIYKEINEVEAAFSDQDTPGLREWAVEPYTRIPEYDPHETVSALLQLPSRMVSRIKQISALILVLGFLLSMNEVIEIGRNGFTIIESLVGVIPLSIIAFVTVYYRFLRTDTFLHRAIATELRAGHPLVATRHRPTIVGYGVWNRSLLGQTGLFLVTFFYLLNALPHLPVLGYVFDDPAGYITSMISENVELVYDADSLLEAITALFSRV